MANKAQQPPHLHLAEVTASQFLDIWKHFDVDEEDSGAFVDTASLQHEDSGSKSQPSWIEFACMAFLVLQFTTDQTVKSHGCVSLLD
ncbi:hypothetical protein ATANTOWER_007893 [Ataeniobius toweri]|uniref:Uncharacterized protein n=1 Tax=Ataeniobius toweri TaxID=208326 RepID=A0ABU7BRD3_9TELE|nr:hypothetical protein [Ataeniobius toweri]